MVELDGRVVRSARVRWMDNLEIRLNRIQLSWSLAIDHNDLLYFSNPKYNLQIVIYTVMTDRLDDIRTVIILTAAPALTVVTV